MGFLVENRQKAQKRATQINGHPNKRVGVVVLQSGK
jgi:hypothetical protein